MERAHPKAQKASPPRQFDARFFIIPCTFVWYKLIFRGKGSQGNLSLGPKDYEKRRKATQLSIQFEKLSEIHI